MSKPATRDDFKPGQIVEHRIRFSVRTDAYATQQFTERHSRAPRNGVSKLQPLTDHYWVIITDRWKVASMGDGSWGAYAEGYSPWPVVFDTHTEAFAFADRMARGGKP